MGAKQLWDGLWNRVTGLGTSVDVTTQRSYAYCLLSQQDIDAAFRGSGMMRKVIEIPALDMVREWRDWDAEKDQTKAIEDEEDRLGLVQKVYIAEILRGLGGGALILGVPGDPAIPANPRMGKGSLAFVHVVGRWQLQLGAMIDDPMDTRFGGPDYFTMTTNRGPVRLHPSRVVCFKGDPLPMMIGTSWEDQFWGSSRVERVLDAVKNSDNAQQAFANLIDKARNTTIGIPGLSDAISTAGGKARIQNRVADLAVGQSMYRVTLFDAGQGGKDGGGESIDHQQVTWAGIPEIIRVFAEVVAALSDIPMTRLWGKAAEGMSASGDSQQTDWRKMVGARQKLQLKPCITMLDAFLIPSALGSKPDDISWAFAPLDTPSETEEATRFKTLTEAMDKVASSGAIPDEAFAKGYQALLVENGFVPGLEAALEEIPEEERYGLNPEPDPLLPDPNALAVPPKPGAMPTMKLAANDVRFLDATPRSLYVRRDVVNVADIAAWARSQGLPTLDDGLHVMLIHSRQPIDWMKIDGEWNADEMGRVTIPPGGVRIVEPLGDRTAVLLFTSSALSWRHESIVRAGASHDYESYQPHISLTGNPVDLAGVEPYRGKIVLGPEIFSEVKE